MKTGMEGFRAAEQKEEVKYYITRVGFYGGFLGWVRLSPLGTSATIWPVVPALDDR
jgi:hypothetical protein